MDAKSGAGERSHPQLSEKLCWKKIALLDMEILNVKGGHLFSNDLMLSLNSPN
jgi:hypothetical protein